MRFLVDAQLPPALARWLASQSDVEADHVVDIGLLEAADIKIWLRAERDGSIIVTKDEDFIVFRARSKTVPILWIRIGNVTNKALLIRFEKDFPAIRAAFERGEELVRLD